MTDANGRNFNNIDERRFAVWNEIHAKAAQRQTVAGIALQTGQPTAVVDYVLHGRALNRIRCLQISGTSSMAVPANWSAAPPAAVAVPDAVPLQQPGPSPSSTVPPVSSAGEVDILAIDFLNLLVRAFHVGKPSDVHAVTSMFRTVANAIRDLKPARVVFCSDGGYAHRTAIFPDYKANRELMPDALRAQRIIAGKAIKAAGFCAVRCEGFEADDVLASIATQNPRTVIASSDKDLLALHGKARIYHPWQPAAFVTPQEKLGVAPGQVADLLALMGDKVDNIPGVPGVGKTKAPELLASFESLEGVLTAAATSQIGGALGQKIKDNIPAALMSAKLVALVTNLELPPLHGWQPPPSWQSQLEALGLRSVVASLAPLAPTCSPAPPAAAATSVMSPHFIAGKEAAARARNLGRQIENPWKRETAEFAAWSNGYASGVK